MDHSHNVAWIGAYSSYDNAIHASWPWWTKHYTKQYQSFVALTEDELPLTRNLTYQWIDESGFWYANALQLWIKLLIPCCKAPVTSYTAALLLKDSAAVGLAHLWIFSATSWSLAKRGFLEALSTIDVYIATSTEVLSTGAGNFMIIISGAPLEHVHVLLS